MVQYSYLVYDRLNAVIIDKSCSDIVRYCCKRNNYLLGAIITGAKIVVKIKLIPSVVLITAISHDFKVNMQ